MVLKTVRTKGTGPELQLRNILEAMKIGDWTWNDSSLPGSPDANHPGLKIAIFADGCYWHGHSCRSPSRWSPKAEEVQERDRKADEELISMGIRVVRVPECLIEKDQAKVLRMIMDLL